MKKIAMALILFSGYCFSMDEYKPEKVGPNIPGSDDKILMDLFSIDMKLDELKRNIVNNGEYWILDDIDNASVLIKKTIQKLTENGGENEYFSDGEANVKIFIPPLASASRPPVTTHYCANLFKNTHFIINEEGQEKSSGNSLSQAERSAFNLLDERFNEYVNFVVENRAEATQRFANKFAYLAFLKKALAEKVVDLELDDFEMMKVYKNTGLKLKNGQPFLSFLDRLLSSQEALTGDDVNRVILELQLMIDDLNETKFNLAMEDSLQDL